MTATLRVWPAPYPRGEHIWELRTGQYYITSENVDSYTTKRAAVKAARNSAKRFGIKIVKEEIET